jgi:hypothetical protein
MHTGKITPSADWRRCAVHVDAVGVFRSTIWSNKLIVSQVGKAGKEITSRIDADRVLLAGGWKDQLLFDSANGTLVVTVDDRTIKIGIEKEGDIASFEISSSFDIFSSDCFTLAVDYHVRKVRFSFVCDSDFIPSMLGAIHVICAVIYSHRQREISA